ncbi:hypothetical protein AJ79_04749 [Helicocarpus griseus UAMH5409]|uniref:Altered inheritance of mitochondria protein 9, mitochondrial n=1 Tax=Helicocarpus griseus UAMH5409 TaxID=1447875 RepID=A0A2B7XRM2_9EURO|nr:hypothetical protein AJ79_04749 [Helicocarpus griseus UAMH5409]
MASRCRRLLLCSFRRPKLVQPDLKKLKTSHSISGQQCNVSQAMSRYPLLAKSPFAYTAGKWLHLDKLQREARYVAFDFERLCEKVLTLCPSAKAIESCEKIEGGFSRAFIMTTDDGRRVVAKYPTSVAGEPRFTTNSEVATVTYLQQKCEIPIPAILDWSDDLTNPIGSAYIIMEHAGGVPLQHHMAAFLSADCQQKLDDPRYCIGPHSRSMYWNCNVGEPRYYIFKGPNRGPWPDLSSYTSALFDVALSRLPPVDHPNATRPQPSYQGSVDKHLHLLEQAQAVIPRLIQHPQIPNATPTLFHPDLHKRNIFVSEDDPTIVTGFIDWQSTCIDPAFYYADDVPDFATPSPEETEEPTENTLCSQPFEAGLSLLGPRLGAARKIDEALLRPLRYCHRTWRDGFVPLMYELMQLRDRWQDLGFEDECPTLAPSSEEMRDYHEQLEIYEKMLSFKQEIVETFGVEEDGWVPEDRWDEVKEAHRHAYETIMKSMKSDKDRADWS